MTKPFEPCCLSLFTWSGTPTGHETTLPISTSNNVYITSPSPQTTTTTTTTINTTSAAILFIHDAAGWTFPNARLLADHFARETPATVYLVDFFENEQLDRDLLLAGRFQDLDMAGFAARNSREKREREIVEAAKYLKTQHSRVGAVGYCFGGWATFRLAGLGLVDAGVVGHPTWLTREDVDGVVDGAPDREKSEDQFRGVPMQVLAPEHDEVFDLEMKHYCVKRFVEAKNGGHFDYRHFPGVVHACFTRGDENVKGEREAMVKGKGAAVSWFREWLVES